MPHNLVLLNEDSTALTVHDAAFRFQTTSRPILIQHQFSSIAAIPMPNLASNKPVLVQLEVLVYKQGLWQKVGSTQISGKDFESTESSVYFTFDVSSILSSEIKSGFYPSVFDYSGQWALSSGLNDDNNPGFSSVIKYKTQARSWFLGLSGQLVLNEATTPVESKIKRACNIYFHPKLKSPNKYANIPLNNASGTVTNPIHNHFMSQISAVSPQLNNKKFLTNCPTSLVRKICLDMPLSVSATALNETITEHIPKLSMKYSITGGSSLDSNHELEPGNFPRTSGTDAADNTTGFGDVATAAISPSSIINAPSDASGSNINSLVRFYLSIEKFSGGSSIGIVDDNIGFGSLDFELHKKIGTSLGTNLPSINKNTCFIYFINDFNVLDYFAFTGEPDIVHEHSKNTFKKGFKDYTSRHSSNFGVSRGSTKEIYTCRELVNKETSEWLAEIYRSTEVYLWDVNESDFIPVLVLDGEIQSFYGNKLELQPFSISFIKETHIVKK